MQRYPKAWPITSTFGMRQRIDTNPDFQRPAVWGASQKHLLIDSILRDYDVPKFYWRLVGKAPDRYEVVDGQQRLRALWEFLAEKYSLPLDLDPVGDYKVAGCKYSSLPDDLRIHLDTYNLDVVILEGADEDEVREMFLRLQNGTTLKAQEKRNAMPGAMRAFVKQLAGHGLFANVGFSNSRYAYDHVAAQMVLLELQGKPANVRNADLTRMYKDKANFDPNVAKAKKVKRVLDYLLLMFPSKTPELERYNVVSLYALISHLQERYVVQGRESAIAQWFIDFEGYRHEQNALPEDDPAKDPEMISYHEKISHSTDAEASLASRHEFLLRRLFEAVPDFALKDDRRVFSHEQRLAIFRRDRGECQVRIACNGVKCDWDNWEADHITPHSKGGLTVVVNGQVACPACNSAKGAILLAAAS